MGVSLNPSLPIVLIAVAVVLALLRWRLRRREFHALVIGTVTAVGLGEVLCRVGGIGSPRYLRLQEERTKSGDAPWAYAPGSSLVFAYPDNPRGYFDENNSVVGRINSRGFRGNDVDVTKRPGSVRYVFLGDSFTLGYGVKDEHTLPAMVERALREQRPDVEVLNFGVNGFNTPEEVDLLKNYAVSFDPDVVVAVLFLNDAGATGTLEYLSRNRYFERIRRYSQFLNATVDLVESRILEREMLREYHASFSGESPGFRRLRESLVDAHALAGHDGFRLVLVVHPVLFKLNGDYPFQAIHRTIEEFCRAEGIDFVDLLPAFLGQRDRDLWVHRADQHPNEIANARSAAYLVDRLGEMDVRR